MRARTTTAIAAIAAVTLACTSATAGAATGRPATHSARRAADSCTTWQTVRSPAPGFTDPPQSYSEAALGSVSVLSGHDVWFAGLNDAGSVTGPWVTHWNGHSVTAPQHVPLIPQAQSPYRNPVEPGSFDSSSDGWILAADQVSPTFDPHEAFGYHWHGGRWTMVPMAGSPEPAREGPRFSAVAAVSPTDAWAVGAFYSTRTLFGLASAGALIAHWNGTTWSIIPNPALNQKGAVLTAIDPVSSSDVWAAGHQGNPGQASDAGHVPFIEHWNGSTWSVVSAPPASKPSYLEAVSGASATDAWAVGYQTKPGTSTLVALAEHWNGKTWAAVSLPASLAGLNGLISVYSAAPNEVWATEGGPHYPDSPSSNTPAMFLHWNGTAWSAAPAPGPQAYGLGYLYTSIDGTGPGNIWAAGTVETGYAGEMYPLIARLSCG
jgi:hypothetical protein